VGLGEVDWAPGRQTAIMESEQQDASFFIATRNDDRTGAGSRSRAARSYLRSHPRRVLFFLVWQFSPF